MGCRMPDLGIVLVSAGSGGGGSLPPGQWEPKALINDEAIAITLGAICYIDADDGAKLAKANGTLAQAYAVAICKSTTIAAGNQGNILFGGLVAGIGGGIGVFGVPMFLSNTPGVMTNVPNTTPGEYNVFLGYFVNADDFQFVPQFPVLD